MSKSHERIRTDVSVAQKKDIDQMSDQPDESTGPATPASNRKILHEIQVRTREIENALVKAGILPSRSRPDEQP